MDSNISNKEFKSLVYYLIHDLNSAISLLGYTNKYYLDKEDLNLDKAKETINNQVKKIKDIEDYFYKKVQEANLLQE